LKVLKASRQIPPQPRLRRGRRLSSIVSAVALGVSLTSSPSRCEEADSTVSAGRAGRLEGSIVLSPKLSARRMRFSLYSDPNQALLSPPPPSVTDEMRNVVVYLESVGPSPVSTPSSGGTSVLKQEGRSFVPHVLPVARGTTVLFPNEDPVYHNVFSLSRAATFDLGRYPQGTSKSFRCDQPGIVQVFCHIHSDMSAIILVLENPFFAVPDSKGRFVIEGIPPGTYRAVAFHERAQRITRSVKIEKGRVSEVQFQIPLTEADNARF